MRDGMIILFSMSRLQRGDVVWYKNALYHCQPNGTACYLYDRPEDIGFPLRAIHIPACRSVEKATDEEAIEFKQAVKPSPRHQLEVQLGPDPLLQAEATKTFSLFPIHVYY